MQFTIGIIDKKKNFYEYNQDKICGLSYNMNNFYFYNIWHYIIIHLIGLLLDILFYDRLNAQQYCILSCNFNL